MRKLFSQILEEIKLTDNEAEKIDTLRINNSLPLRQLLCAAFDPTITFDVKIESYKENEETDGYATNNLFVEAKRLYIFMDSYNLSPQRKSVLLIQILESIDRSDAIAFIDVLNKDLGKYGLTVDVINQAFPGLIKHE